jgi:hypothetical protein
VAVKQPADTNQGENMTTARATFNWRGFAWEVTTTKSGDFVYRDAAHIGGPWSLCSSTIANKSVNSTFRRLLKKAAEGGVK